MQTETMPKTNACVARKYKEKYEELKRNYDNVCQKNVKHMKVNKRFHEENSNLKEANSKVVLKQMGMKSKLKEKEEKFGKLELEIK